MFSRERVLYNPRTSNGMVLMVLSPVYIRLLLSLQNKMCLKYGLLVYNMFRSQNDIRKTGSLKLMSMSKSGSPARVKTCYAL